jgi:hypothetical protein
MFARMFSSFLFNWRKEADDRKAPGGCSSLSILPCAFCVTQKPLKPFICSTNAQDLSHVLSGAHNECTRKAV